MHVFAWLGGGLAAIACSSAPVGGLTSAAVKPPERDGANSHRVAELARASDVRNYALRTEAPPPARFVPFDPRADALPPFDHVVAYLVNFDRGLEPPGAPGSSPCGGAVAANGALCPSVVLPGVKLSSDAAREIAELTLRRARTPKVATGCAGRPHHSFVFYSGDGVPVFEWLVDVRCGRSSSSEWLLPTDVRDRVTTVCEQAGMGMCFLHDSAARDEVNRAFAEHYVDRTPLGTRRLKPFPLGVPGDRALSELQPAEQRELCAWNVQHTDSALEPGGDARTNEAGVGARLLAVTECAARFPRCGVRVAQILPCMDDAQRGAPALLPFSDPTCTARRSCLWGFELLPGKT